jgi:hypothetical protein
MTLGFGLLLMPLALLGIFRLVASVTHSLR